MRSTMRVEICCAATAVLAMATPAALSQALQPQPGKGNVGDFELAVLWADPNSPTPIELYSVEGGQNDTGGYWGSGQVVPVMVTPLVPGFNCTVTLTADFQNLSAGVAAPPGPPWCGFEDPLNPTQTPQTSLAITFTPANPNAIPPAREVYMDVELPMGPGLAPPALPDGDTSWGMKVDGTAAGNTVTSPEAPITIASSTAPSTSTGPPWGEAHGGPYLKDETPVHYDALQDVGLTLPDTGPAMCQLVQGYNGDQAYIYSGGDVYINGAQTSALDCGLFLPRTGNWGWVPFYNYGGMNGAANYPNDQIQGGQTLVVRFEAPGYSDPDLQASVADGYVWLVVAAPPGGKVRYSDDRGKTEAWYTLRCYTFPVAGGNWQQKNAPGFEVKRVNSIAMNPSMWYNAPPNAVFGGDEDHMPPLYTSGSFVTGGGWSYPEFHYYDDPNHLDQFVTLDNLTLASSPAAPYVSGGYVDTLGKQR